MKSEDKKWMSRLLTNFEWRRIRHRPI